MPDDVQIQHFLFLPNCKALHCEQVLHAYESTLLLIVSASANDLVGFGEAADMQFTAVIVRAVPLCATDYQDRFVRHERWRNEAPNRRLGGERPPIELRIVKHSLKSRSIWKPVRPDLKGAFEIVRTLALDAGD
jgi:hypothetical protein